MYVHIYLAIYIANNFLQLKLGIGFYWMITFRKRQSKEKNLALSSSL